MDEKFVVIFYDDDRKTILEKKEVIKGQKVEFTGKIPEKPVMQGVKYVFSGWETKGDMSSIKENMKLYAKYEESDSLFELSEENAENAKLNEVMQAGQKVNTVEKAVRDLSEQEKQNLINKIIEKGSATIENSKDDIERD